MNKQKIYTKNEISYMLKDIFLENKVTRAYLFGSYAYGKPTEKSDIDIVAEFEEQMPFFDVCAIAYDVRKKLNKDVDFFDIKEFSQLPNMLLKIKQEGVCIYERQ